jgi:hypothetical protein
MIHAFLTAKELNKVTNDLPKVKFEKNPGQLNADD